MTQEVEQAHQEKPATHKKNAQTYGLVIAVIISVALVITSFIQYSSIDNEPKKEKQIRKPVVETSRKRDFDEQFVMADRRIKQSQQEGEEMTLEKLVQQKKEKFKEQKQAYNQFINPPKKTENPLQQWQQEEKIRALKARRSALKVDLSSDRKKTYTENRQRPRSPLNHVSYTDTSSMSQLDKERAMIQDKINKLEYQIAESKKGYGSFNQGLGSKSQKPLGNRFSSESGGDIVIGEPSSERQPKPGELPLPTATVIRASLDSVSISDYLGSFKGQVIEDVYDVSGEYILIPKGTKIDGKTLRISNINEPIQNRMSMMTRWFILPNGKRISLKKAEAMDFAGVGALEGDVNRHLIAQFLGVAAYAVIANESSRQGSSYFDETDYAGEVGQGLRDQFAPLAQKYLALVPTVTLPRGTPMRVYIEDDIYLKPWKKTVSGLLSAY